MRGLLANAPADRAWRRRGYLVLCRVHPERLQQKQVISGTRHTNAPATDRSLDTGYCTVLRTPAEASDCHETAVGGSNVDELDGGWAAAVTKVSRLPEEGEFRTIVGYL